MNKQEFSFKYIEEGCYIVVKHTTGQYVATFVLVEHADIFTRLLNQEWSILPYNVREVGLEEADTRKLLN